MMIKKALIKNGQCWRWAFLDWFYSKIRFLFVNNVDPNEDFYCMFCDKPVLKRYLFCSVQCSNMFEELEKEGQES